jgi:hypothetical protein
MSLQMHPFWDEFGGTTSVRPKDESFCPLVVFGQDHELAFHQLMLKAKNWVGRNGERHSFPKMMALLS